MIDVVRYCTAVIHCSANIYCITDMIHRLIHHSGTFMKCWVKAEVIHGMGGGDGGMMMRDKGGIDKGREGTESVKLRNIVTLQSDAQSSEMCTSTTNNKGTSS